MKTINYSLLSCLFGLILGLVLVIWPEVIANYLIFAIGLVFMIPGIISIIKYFIDNAKYRDESVSFRFPIAGTGSFIFGIILMAMPSFFANAIIFILGIIVAIAGITQIAQLLKAKEWIKVPVTAYIIPILLFILGLLVILNSEKAKETSFFIVGIGILVYSISGFFTWLFIMRKKPKSTIRKTVDIEDAEIVQ